MHQTFYLSLFLHISAKRAAGLKLAFEKPLLVLWIGFQISPLGLLFGFCTANGPVPFRKANRGAQHPGGPRPIELWARWLIDSKSWVLTISELPRVLDALEDETYCKYQAWGEEGGGGGGGGGGGARLPILWLIYRCI